MTEEPVFVRKASGLIRRVSPLQAFSYSFQAPCLCVMALYLVWGTLLYPGANYVLGSWAVIVIYPAVAIYLLLAIAMPRSGGEYLYVSRSIGPGWGLFTSWAVTINSYLWPGLIAQLTWYYALPPLVMALGTLTGNPGLRTLGFALGDPSSPMYIYTFLAAIIWLVFSNLVHYAGVQWVARVSVVSLVVILLEFVVWTAIFAPSNPASFVAAVQSQTGINFQTDVIQAAQNTGTFVSGTVLTMSIFAGAIYVSQNTLASTIPANFCGEIKSVAKSQTVAQLGSIAAYALLYTYGAWLVYHAVGLENYQAICQLLNVGASAPYFSRAAEILGSFPSFLTLGLYATNNVYLQILSPILYIIANWCSVSALPMGASRNMFAYSMDGLLPAWMSKVDRRGSPWVLCIMAFIASVIGCYLTFYTPYMSMVAYSTAIWFIGWIVLGIGAMTFPYAKGSRSIFAKAPPIVRTKIGPVPLLVLCGLGATVSSIWIVYICIMPALTGGALALQPLITTVAICSLTPWIIYGLARAYNKSKGIDLMRRFREIPPD